MPRALAGLALHEDTLRYMEIEAGEEGLLVRRKGAFPLPPGCVVRGAVLDFSPLEEGLQGLRGSLGRTVPVVLGLPAGGAVLRLLEYPPMPLSEARDAMALEFERLFPHPRAESVADLAEVEIPERSGTKKAFLAAAARRDLVDNLLRVARRAGFSVRAVEPMTAALLRAAAGAKGREGAYLLIWVARGIVEFILGYRDNGILFRSVPYAAGADLLREVRDTLNFAGTQRQGLEVSSLFLVGDPVEEGLEDALKEEGVRRLDLGALWGIRDQGDLSRFEAAVGLALRDTP